MSNPERDYEISNTKEGRLSFVVDNTQFGAYRLELNRKEKNGFHYNFINLTEEELYNLYEVIGNEIKGEVAQDILNHIRERIEHSEYPPVPYQEWPIAERNIAMTPRERQCAREHYAHAYEVERNHILSLLEV